MEQASSFLNGILGNGTVEFLKTISGIITSIGIIVAFVTATIKPFRKRFVDWIRKNSQTEQICERLDNIEHAVEGVREKIGDMKEHLNTHIEQNNEDFECSKEAQMLSLRCQIREIYTKNYSRKELTMREQRDLHDFFGAYKRLGGNSYV